MIYQNLSYSLRAFKRRDVKQQLKHQQEIEKHDKIKLSKQYKELYNLKRLPRNFLKQSTQLIKDKIIEKQLEDEFIRNEFSKDMNELKQLYRKRFKTNTNINVFDKLVQELYLDISTIIEYISPKFIKNGTIYVTLINEDKKIEHKIFDTKYMDKKQVKDFIAQLTYNNIIVYIKMTRRDKSATFSPMFDGKNNCVIQCLKDLDIKFPPKSSFDILNNKYLESGVNHEQLHDIATKLKVKLNLFVHNNKFQYGNQKSKYKTYNLYNRNAHCTIKPLEKNTNIYVDTKDLTELLNTFQAKSIMNLYEKDNKILSFEVQEDNKYNNYLVKYDDKINLEETKCLSAIQYYTKLFTKNNKHIDTIQYNHENIDIIKLLSKNSIFYNKQTSIFNHETLEYENIKQYKTIDLKQAFNNYNKYKEYTGFPQNLNIALNPNSLTDEVLYKYEGIVFITYNNIITNESLNSLVSFQFLRFLKESNIEYKMHFVLMSNKVIHLNTSDFTTLNKRCFQKVLGALQKTTKSSSFTTTDKSVAKWYGSVQSYASFESEDELYYCVESYDDKELKQYMPHVTHYIKDLVNIQIYKQVLKLKQNNIDIKRIWCDGIDIEESTDLTNLYDESLFSIKPTKINDNINTTIESLEIKTPKLYDSFNTLDLNNKVTFITGAPGTGKSYNIKQIYNQNSNCKILVPTILLKDNYKGYDVDTFQSTYKYKSMKKYNIIFIDEVTMISEKDFDTFLLKLDESTKVIIVGDHNQLSLEIKGHRQIDYSKYRTIMLTKNYRQLDYSFQDKIEKVKEDGKINWVKSISMNEAVTKPNSIILSAVNSDIEKINKLGYKLNIQPEKNNMKLNTPIRFTENTTLYSKNDMGIVTSLNDTTFTVLSKNSYIDIAYDSKNFMFAYSITFHCVQGQTIKNKNIIINQNRLFDFKKMLYVAVSRAVNENQLFKIVY